MMQGKTIYNWWGNEKKCDHTKDIKRLSTEVITKNLLNIGKETDSREVKHIELQLAIAKIKSVSYI